MMNQKRSITDSQNNKKITNVSLKQNQPMFVPNKQIEQPFASYNEQGAQPGNKDSYSYVTKSTHSSTLQKSMNQVPQQPQQQNIAPSKK